MSNSYYDDDAINDNKNDNVIATIKTTKLIFLKID